MTDMQVAYTSLMKSLKQRNSWTNAKFYSVLCKKVGDENNLNKSQATSKVTKWLNGHDKVPADYVMATVTLAIEAGIL